MYEGLCVAVVVPAHNEAKHIADVVSGLPQWVDHIIVVDDVSTDDTAAAAEATGDPRVEVIRHEVNRGVGGSIMTGHRRVLEVGADVSVVMAGDDQMDPIHLPALLAPIVAGDAEFTKANRFYAIGSFEGMPRLRVWGNIGMSFLTKAASGYWNLFDPQNGYTAVHRKALERLPMDRLSARYDFENDILIHLNILRVRAADVPVPARYGAEVSGMRLMSDGWRILGRLYSGFWTRIWWKYVLQSFSAVALMLFGGLGLMFLGTLVGVFIVVNTLGPPVASAGTVLLCVAPLLGGFQMLLYSLLLDIQEANG